MTTLANGLRQLRCPSQLARTQWLRPASIRPVIPFGSRSSSTDSSNSITPQYQAAVKAVNSIPMPFQGIKHARAVPMAPSYFSREPQFNEMYIAITRLATKYHRLPKLLSNEARQVPWVRLQEMREKLGEHIKASHYARALHAAKLLYLIHPSVMPEEVKLAVGAFQRDISILENLERPGVVDDLGRAVGVGRRKESTARAWVVEGKGEVLINGKPLSDAFGRIHERESAIWALQATERLDKYNVWALVKGGGKTGQAEALTLAVAKALIVHEPALKTALRKAGCITRDARAVERKHHGHLKARKMPAWVKR